MFSNDDINIMIDLICTELEVHPNENLIRNINLYIRQYDKNILLNQFKNLEKVYSKIKSSYITHLTTKQRSDTKKVQKYQKDIIQNADKKDDSITTLLKSKLFINADWLWANATVLLDTKYQDLSNTDKSRYNFYISPNTSTDYNQSGMITSYSDIKNITQIKIGSFILPYINNNLNYFHEITLTFLGINSNAYYTNEKNNNFHFKFIYDVSSFNNNLVILKPVKDTFTFTTPITHLEDISIRFQDPIYPIIFNADRMYPSNFNYSSNPGQITFATNHNLYNNDVIVINGLTTFDDNVNSTILSQINNIRGVVVSVISPTVISISYDFTQIINPNNTSLPLIYFESKRIRIPIDIKYINHNNYNE